MKAFAASPPFVDGTRKTVPRVDGAAAVSFPPAIAGAGICAMVAGDDERRARTEGVALER